VDRLDAIAQAMGQWPRQVVDDGTWHEATEIVVNVKLQPPAPGRHAGCNRQPRVARSHRWFRFQRSGTTLQDMYEIYTTHYGGSEWFNSQLHIDWRGRRAYVHYLWPLITNCQ
jgi:hypothetical protein